MARSRVPWVWDYDLDEEEFARLLSGELKRGTLDQDWAMVRLLEYAPYREIVRRVGFRSLVRGWSRWRSGVRSPSRVRGLDFLVDYLKVNRADLVE